MTDSSTHDPAHPPAPFGTLLGACNSKVPVYSSHYESANPNDFPDRLSYRSYVDGIFMGYKWQCVELARRWLYLNRGYIFDDIAMAYDIFHLRSVRVIKDNSRLPLRSFRNGSKRPPEPGCLLIWNEGGEFEHTGHVAIVTEVIGNRVRCIEQNVDHVIWHNTQDSSRNYSRELIAHISPRGEFHIDCSFPNTTICGWVIQTDDATHAEPQCDIDPRLLRIEKHQAKDQGQLNKPWLDLTQPDEAAFVQMMQGHKLSGKTKDQYSYLCISETAHRELKNVTNELHGLFTRATNYILRHEELLTLFNIPRALWPMLRQSWENRATDMITGRFDFSMSPYGLKAYEYNADSASCHLECGKIQVKWAEQVGCTEGWCPGEDLHEQLVDAWRARKITGTLHILQDDDPEETYHALYMQSAMHEAGIHSKIITGLQDLRWNEHNQVVDADGEVIRWVWKTWAWETALDQIREECAADETALQSGKPLVRTATPRLVDVLLDPEVMVYEPLWTLIPSNKAVLAVLWEMFPGQPNLLQTSFTLTNTLQQNGYVTKPLAGRSGFDISIINPQNTFQQTNGKFAHQNLIYQEFFSLPEIDGEHIQLSTFTVDGEYAGSCVRADESPIITTHSDLLALRVIDDEHFLNG
jgi:glutathionylspermidine amidase/synthetase